MALVAIGSLRIALTYTVFNHTIDEPAHIACGMEWLDRIAPEKTIGIQSPASTRAVRFSAPAIPTANRARNGSGVWTSRTIGR